MAYELFRLSLIQVFGHQMHQLVSRLYAQFLVQVVDMVLHGMVGNEQRLFDFLVAFSVQDKL